MLCLIPVFVLAFIVIAMVVTDYHTRNVGYALKGVPSSASLAQEALDAIIVDTAHARMMRKALPYNGLGVMLDSLVAPTWALAREVEKEIVFTREWRSTVWERLILAFGVIAALVGLTTVANAQDVSELDLVCHIVNRDVAVCHTVDYSSEYVCAWTVDGVSNCRTK